METKLIRMRIALLFLLSFAEKVYQKMPRGTEAANETGRAG